MAKDPAFLFYPNDWLGGTMGMTFEEKGAYMELLMLQFNRGHMTKHMIGRTVGQLWDNIKDKFMEDSSGLFYNARLEEEQTKRKAYSESRRNNKKGTNQYTKPKPKKVGHTSSHMEDENEDVIDLNKESEFETFWNAGLLKLDRRKCENEWFDIDNAEYSKILEHVPKFVAASGDYPKSAFNYLIGRNWQDEDLPNYAAKPIEEPQVKVKINTHPDLLRK